MFGRKALAAASRAAPALWRVGGARHLRRYASAADATSAEEETEAAAARTSRPYEREFYRRFPQLVGPPQEEEDPRAAVDKKLEDVRNTIAAVEDELARTGSRLDDADRGTPDFTFGSKKVWVGDHFPMGNDVVEKWVPEGFGSRIEEFEFEEMGHDRVLARAELFRLTRELEEMRASGFSTKKGARSIIFDGENGVGKSTMLTQLVYWARTNGWLVLYIPDGLTMVGYMSIKRSEMFPGQYDQPEFAEALLATLLEAHGEQLEQLPIRSPLSKAVKDQEFSGSNWRELAQFGLEYEGVASDVLNLFRQDLNSITEFPVLVVVDDYNLAMGKSFYPDMDDKSKGVPRLHCDRLSFVSMLNDPTSHGIANGTLVGATDRRLGMKGMRAANLPHELIRDCEPYTFNEFLSHYDFYVDQRWITQELSTESLNYIYRYTNGHPLEVYKYFGMC